MWQWEARQYFEQKQIEIGVAQLRLQKSRQNPRC